MNGSYKICLPALIAITLLTGTQVTRAQSNTEVFGQNRLQYRKFEWKFFETEHFRIYHYDRAGRGLARYVTEQVENDIAVVEKKMGAVFSKKFKIILYNNYDEYRQSNIGRRYDSQLRDMPTAFLSVDLVGDKMVIYFSGVHADLRRQTRAAMSKVVMEQMLFGDNFREVVRNAVFMNMPRWVLFGFTAYLVDGWDPKSNTDWKNLLASRGNKSFYEIAEEQPELAGKAFWKYISDKYGDNTMKGLLYNIQLKNSLTQGVQATLAQKIKATFDSTIAYYAGVYALDELNQEKPDSASAKLVVDIPNDNSEITSIKVGPKGNDVAYVSWKYGQYRVYLQSVLGPQARGMILEGGRMNYNEPADPNYPLLAWSNTGYKLAILYKEGRTTRLRVYNSLKARIENYVIPANRFDRVLSMTFNEDDDKIIFSAIKKSQTDLFEFTIKGARMLNITNDAWDDLEPCFISGGSRRGILFLSNRTIPNINAPLEVNQLPAGPMNVFFYNTRTKRRELLQMTHVTTGNISQPIQYGSEHYAYLYDVNGVVNKYVIVIKHNKNNMDSAWSAPVTNHQRNIVSHQYSAASRKVADVLQVGNKYIVYYVPILVPGENIAPKHLKPTLLTVAERNKLFSAQEGKNGEPLLKGGTVFRSDFMDTGDAPAANVILSEPAMEPDEQEVDSMYMKMKAQEYRLALKPDFLQARLDQSVLFNRYQPAKQTNGFYKTPDLASLITISLDDLMEDYKLTGGLRVPFSFRGLTYFLQYENFRNKIDWGITYLRQDNINNETVVDTITNKLSEQISKINTNIIQGNFSYPLDPVQSVRLQLGIRMDKKTYLAQDRFSLGYNPPNDKLYWAMSRLEYVFDNTKHPTVNIYQGFRYKFFAEFTTQLNNGGGGFKNIGTDFRYYAKVYKNMTWAIRLAGATSGGKQKVLYHIGGVDNAFNPKYSRYVPVRPTENYGFETLATNLRGYEQNSRNGNTYALMNMELRLPLITTFAKRPVQSSFMKNLQLIGFYDMGSAWTGFWPNADRLRNDITLVDPPPNNQVILQITDETAGLGIGYGAGLRSMLFGYFLRVDAAWNTEGRTKPLLHVSLGTDF
jgi:hypothetical protein